MRADTLVGIVARAYHFIDRKMVRGGRHHRSGGDSRHGPVVSTRPDGSVSCEVCGKVEPPASIHLDWHYERFRRMGRW